MNFCEAVNYCFEKEGNRVYSKALDMYIYSGKMGSRDMYDTHLFLYLNTLPYPTPLTINNELVNLHFEVKD